MPLILSPSHLLQMRGLKLQRVIQIERMGLSHLLQMRGLKHIAFAQKLNPGDVASFTDAWIETSGRR